MKKFDVNTLKINHCIKCDISLTRRSIVNGRGNIESKVMIIGEAPGAFEDKTGIPFIGPAGQLLRKLLRYLMIEPKELYITNSTKCRPNSNRPPSDVELENCLPYLAIEIAKVNPKVILLLGNVALSSTYPIPFSTISRERGKLRIINGRIILATYHPSYILRNKDDVELLKEFWRDLVLFQTLVKYIYS